MPLTCTAAGERNFYPRPPRGGRRRAAKKISFRWLISIHVLREEDDPSLASARRGF